MSANGNNISGLYRSEKDRLVRQISYRVGCRFAAADLVQDVFLRLWEKATPLKGDSRAYLTRCARNAAIDHRRAEQARGRLVSGLVAEQIATTVSSSEQILAGRETLGELGAVLRALPKGTRHVFVLNRVHGCSFSEIAEVMGISRRTVATRMAQALEACSGVKSDAQ